MPLDRRDFVKGALGATGAAWVGSKLGHSTAGWALDQPAAAAARAAALPHPERSGIEHVVVVMMENRSFDHLLGWLPGADGRQHGLSYEAPDGTRHKTFHQKQLNGCGFADPDHSYNGGRIQYNGGKMDGFLTDARNDSFAISYYKAADRPFMASLARHYTTCDRYFCSILGPTYPNRIFQHAAQTDRTSNTPVVSTLPTIWDRLNQPGGPTGHYYFSDVPFLALWGGKYSSIWSPLPQFLWDAAAGTLPNVSFVEPSFLGEGDATGNDDHPRCDLRAGDAFLSQVFHTLASGPGWANTVLVINYDEWGGFYEHVRPRRITAGVPIGSDPHTGIDQDLDAKGRVLGGFRVPCIVASPFARRAPRDSVTHGHYDHTSVLKLIEWRWGLAPLTARDASNAHYDPRNLVHTLDLKHPDPKVPSSIREPAPFVPVACQPAAATTAARSNDPGAGNEDWLALRDLASSLPVSQRPPGL